TRLQGDWSSDVCSSDLCPGRIPREPGTGKQKNIHPTIVVVVNESATTAGRFQNVFVGISTTVDDRCLQPRPRRHIYEMSIERTRSEERRVGKECRCRGG